MTDEAEPGRQPAHDLAAFDVSKRSPEQIAQAFARWKERRKRPQPGPAPARAGQPPDSRPAPAITRSVAREPEFEPAEKPREIQYSTPFAALLAAGSEPTAEHRIWYPGAALPRLRRPQPTRRRPKVAWVLTGAATVFALAVMASGALLEQSEWRSPAGAEPRVAQVLAQEIPFVATATAARAAEWRLQRTIDLALMKAAPVAQAVHQPAAAIQTASKAAPPAAQPLSEPKLDIAAPEALQFVPKPFVPSVAPAFVGSPAATRAGVVGDPRPDALVQRGHDNSKNALGANNRAAASGSKPAGAAGSGGSNDPRSASSRSGRAATDGASDPASGGTASTGEGDGSGAGGDAGGDTSGGDAGDDAGGSDSGADAAGGESSGDVGSGDSGGDTGSGETGGESGGDAADGGSDDGDSGGNGGAENEDKNKDKSD